MIRIIGNIPKGKFAVACSGGVDSMAILDFLISGRYNPLVIHFNHNTDHGKEAEDFLIRYCKKRNLEIYVGRTDQEPMSNKEKIWSDLRYKFFSEFKMPVITCHHLDDSVETYIFSSLRGFHSVIPYSKGNVIRPFLLNEKLVLEQWAKRRKLEFVEDLSNYSLEHSRNRIRHNIIPECLIVNPGLKSVVRKIIENKYPKDLDPLEYME